MYEDEAAAVLEALQESGTEALVQRSAAPGYDPTSDTETPSTPLQARTLAIEDSTLGEQTTESGSRVRRRTPTLWAAPQGIPFEPKTGDKVIWPADGGRVFTITAAGRVAPAGVAILYRWEIGV